MRSTTRRSSVNDNITADIYGVEAEAVISPTPALLVNANFSYLKFKVYDDRILPTPRDPSGGRSDAVIINYLTDSSNCPVTIELHRYGVAAGFQF